MSYEISINGRNATIELLNRKENKILISVNGKKYDADIVMVENGVYSIIMEGVSYNVELFNNSSAKNYIVNTLYESFDVEIIDSESKYQKSRKKEDEDDDNVISTPMPGQIFLPVNLGMFKLRMDCFHLSQLLQ